MQEPTKSDFEVPAYVEIECLRRDLAFLMVELAGQSSLSGDFYWNEIFNRRYWNFFTVAGLAPSIQYELRVYGLLAVITMANDAACGADYYVTMFKHEIRLALSQLEVTDPEEQRLLALACSAFEAAIAELPSLSEESFAIGKECDWADERFVVGYFQGHLDLAQHRLS